MSAELSLYSNHRILYPRNFRYECHGNLSTLLFFYDLVESRFTSPRANACSLTIESNRIRIRIPSQEMEEKTGHEQEFLFFFVFFPFSSSLTAILPGFLASLLVFLPQLVSNKKTEDWNPHSPHRHPLRITHFTFSLL